MYILYYGIDADYNSDDVDDDDNSDTVDVNAAADDDYDDDEDIHAFNDAMHADNYLTYLFKHRKYMVVI